MIGGLGYGWLWDRLSKLPCRCETAPGHRPPIYFLTADIEQLWAVFHVMDWRQFLCEQRFFFFAGADAVEQLQAAMIADPTVPRPKACLRIEQALWRKQDFDRMLAQVSTETDRRAAEIRSQLDAYYAGLSENEWINRLRSGKLRVLGITSRYTTFLQYSMRDWLSGMESLGHQTRLLIEPADHVMPGSFGFAKGLLDYKPDLLVMIDHYRAEIGKVPANLPCVMWVQDSLPNIYNDATGAGQQPRDYCMGFGRLPLTQLHGYPAQRFMACPIGINVERFKPAVLSEQDWGRYGCDVSYVSHASVPSDVLLKRALEKNPDPATAKLLWDLHDRLVGDFERGGVTHAEWQLKIKLQESIAQTGIEPGANGEHEILWLFNQQINNAIFRHQALRWATRSWRSLKAVWKQLGKTSNAEPLCMRTRGYAARCAQDAPLRR